MPRKLGRSDFKVQKQYGISIKIKAWRSGSELTVELYGTKVSRNLRKNGICGFEIIPYEVQYKEDILHCSGETKSHSMTNGIR